MRLHQAVAAFSVIVVAATARPASAQSFFDELPAVSVRPFVLVASERFAAVQTFEAVFGSAVQQVWGGGVQLAGRSGFFFDVTVSRFKKTGERAFFFDGDGFGLGIPLTVTLTPIEFTAGARFRPATRVSPYAGGGVGSYRYQETSDFDDGAFEERRVGYLAVGGVDFRLARWLSVSGDVQYTRVTGIIGSGGVSQESGENNLGGIAARFRVLVGR